MSDPVGGETRRPHRYIGRHSGRRLRCRGLDPVHRPKLSPAGRYARAPSAAHAHRSVADEIAATSGGRGVSLFASAPPWRGPSPWGRTGRSEGRRGRCSARYPRCRRTRATGPAVRRWVGPYVCSPLATPVPGCQAGTLGGTGGRDGIHTAAELRQGTHRVRLGRVAGGCPKPSPRDRRASPGRLRWSVGRGTGHPIVALLTSSGATVRS
jgi:hypothetical protein